MKLQTKLSALRKCERRAKEAEDSFEDYAGSVGLPDCPITIDRSQNRFSRQADRLEASILKDFEEMELRHEAMVMSHLSEDLLEVIDQNFQELKRN